MKNWGVENVFQNEDIIDKIKETNFKKYGTTSFTKTLEYREKTREAKIKKNIIIFEEEKIDFKKYRKLVRSHTHFNKKKLIENWNGLDFYDNEYIEKNLKLNFNDSNYPTIDHKISVFQGFKSMIEPEIIGGIDNLCFTKRNNNSSKHSHLKKPKRLL